MSLSSWCLNHTSVSSVIVTRMIEKSCWLAELCVLFRFSYQHNMVQIFYQMFYPRGTQFLCMKRSVHQDPQHNYFHVILVVLLGMVLSGSRFKSHSFSCHFSAEEDWGPKEKKQWGGAENKGLVGRKANFLLNSVYYFIFECWPVSEIDFNTKMKVLKLLRMKLFFSPFVALFLLKTFSMLMLCHIFFKSILWKNKRCVITW